MRQTERSVLTCVQTAKERSLIVFPIRGLVVHTGMPTGTFLLFLKQLQNISGLWPLLPYKSFETSLA